jgi:nitrite reductase (NADH) large subunit
MALQWGCTYDVRVFDCEESLKAHVKFFHEGKPYAFEMRAPEMSLTEMLTGKKPAAAAAKPAQGGAAGGIPMSEIAKHKSKESAWVVLHDNVYDLTNFLDDHPGGHEVVLKWSGRDATKFWSAIHKKEWIDEYVKDEWKLGPVGPEPKVDEDAALKQMREENEKLKAELSSLKAAPTKPSPGLAGAIQVATLGRQLSSQGPAPDVRKPSKGPPSKTELSGRKIVVVGHGPVGHDFAVKLVGMVGVGALDITILGEEPRLAYDRVHLTEYFEHRDASKLSMCDPKWGEEHKVNIQIDVRVENIDREKQTLAVKNVKTGKVENMSYDACVLATGSYPFVPPITNLDVNTKGVFVYRNIEDLEGMIGYARTSKRAVVIGGGLLGLEAAKAAYDLGQETHVLEMAPFLMPAQLDPGAGAAVQAKVETMGIVIHTGCKIISIVVEDNKFKGIRMSDSKNKEEFVLEMDMLVVSAGVRPRDELARGCGLTLGARGGVDVDARMASSDPKIFAVGEVASFKGMCYGLIAPGWDQATVLAKNFEDATWVNKKKLNADLKALESDGPPLYEGSDLSTKLKLLGCDVASFGSSLDFWFKKQFDESKQKELGINMTLQVDPFTNLYRKLVFSEDNQKLLGGILVGNVEDYYSLLNLASKDDLGSKAPVDLFLGGSSGDGDVGDLADDAIVCLCQKVTKGQIVDAVKNQDCATIPEIKRATTAGNGCGGCVLNTGFVPKILKAALEECGKKAFTGISPAFPFTRAELFDIIRLKELKTWEDVVAECSREGKIADLKKSLAGDEVCKPVVASILASLWQQNPTSDGMQKLQDTNDQYLGNIQRSGQYSVIPRVPGGELTAEELILMGTVAKKFNLWCKVTGAQRIGLFGANVWQLPQIWEDICYGKSSFKDPEGKLNVTVETDGMESGHAYGKALRAVKSCVGTSWCRFGQQDSVSMAVRLEERYKGFRAPHKFKMGVSGCMRECAEAQGKDMGLVATVKGYNLYVGGNHGTSPKHATLFAEDVDDDTALLYMDRILMYYTFTSDPLTRTSKWLENLEGGVEALREVVINDKLGICADLDAQMQKQVDTFECEWKRVVDTPDLRKKFKQFVNVDDTKYGDLDWTMVRKQKKIQLDDLPTIIGAAKIGKEKKDDTWSWVDVGAVADFPENRGAAVKISNSELAVWNHGAVGKWYAAQNSCPHKQLQVLSRGLIGMQGDMPKVACPIHKNTYNLETGKGISNPGLNLATFEVKLENDRVLLHLPPKDVLDAALAAKAVKGNEGDHSCGGACGGPPKELDW